MERRNVGRPYCNHITLPKPSQWFLNACTQKKITVSVRIQIPILIRIQEPPSTAAHSVTNRGPARPTTKAPRGHTTPVSGSAAARES